MINAQFIHHKDNYSIRFLKEHRSLFKNLEYPVNKKKKLMSVYSYILKYSKDGVLTKSINQLLTMYKRKGCKISVQYFYDLIDVLSELKLLKREGRKVLLIGCDGFFEVKESKQVVKEIEEAKATTDATIDYITSIEPEEETSETTKIKTENDYNNLFDRVLSNSHKKPLEKIVEIQKDPQPVDITGLDDVSENPNYKLLINNNINTNTLIEKNDFSNINSEVQEIEIKEPKEFVNNDVVAMVEIVAIIPSICKDLAIYGKKLIKTITKYIREKLEKYNIKINRAGLKAYLMKAIKEKYDYLTTQWHKNRQMFGNNVISDARPNIIDPMKFNNFEAREYDYDELEKKLLGWN